MDLRKTGGKLAMRYEETAANLRFHMATVVRELADAANLQPGRLLIVGASTSEVAGQRIGTAGALEVAEQLLAGVQEVQQAYGFAVAFQCCEHLNRALVLERTMLERFALKEVAAVPVPKAGGAMAAAAFGSLEEPCLVETLEAHAGLDVGETLIGMHLRRVAVPFRPSLRYIGEARVNAAFTRPPLIGGERARYQLNEQK